jgi:phage host-nuclease inhibitor protein Gam
MALKSKSPANPVPQTREDACKALAEYAEIDRAVTQLTIEMNARLDEIKRDYYTRAQPLTAKAETLSSAIQAFCEANRSDLTKAGKTKTVNFGVGKVSWKNQPAKVAFTGNEDDLIDFIRRSEDKELSDLLRATFAINRVFALNRPDLVSKVPGIEIVEGSEAFEIKPDKAKLPETATAEAAE